MPADKSPVLAKNDEGVAAHTPGPWKVIYQNGAAIAVESPSVAHIAGETYPVRRNGIGSPYSAKGHANARLIASAPDLLEALKAMMPPADDWEEDRDDISAETLANITISLGDLWRARSAIQRAEAGQ